MTDIVYPDLKTMGERLAPDVERVFSGFTQHLADAMHRRAKAGLAKRVPVDTGFLYSSLEEDRQPARFASGFTASYANALDRGRRRSQPFSRQLRPGASQRGRRGRLLGQHGTAPYTRTLGSKQPQARRGMTLSTGMSLRAQWPEIMKEAADAAGGSEE
jgi:hypothetical protein